VDLFAKELMQVNMSVINKMLFILILTFV